MCGRAWVSGQHLFWSLLALSGRGSSLSVLTRKSLDRAESLSTVSVPSALHVV